MSTRPAGSGSAALVPFLGAESVTSLRAAFDSLVTAAGLPPAPPSAPPRTLGGAAP